MRVYLTLLLILTCVFNIKAQIEYKFNYKQGSAFIRKAESNLKSGNFTKSEKMISKAKSSDYGFCGNAWASAHSDIAMIEVALLNKQKKFDQALTVLDSLSGCSIGADCSSRDSLKVVTLIFKFGKQKVSESFKKVNKANKLEDDFAYGYWIFLNDLNYKFSFEPSRPIFINGSNFEDAKSDNGFYDLAKDLPFYKLLN